MFRYFGFGSNMNVVSLRAKGVEPLSWCPAVLPGWCLCFNVKHFFRHEGGVGNIEPTDVPDSQVMGVLYECPAESLSSLDAMEALGYGYQRVTVEVQAGEEVVSAFVYVGTPDFIDNSCRPTRRYLNILVEGARQAGLDPDYIRVLSEQKIHQQEQYPLFQPPAGNYPLFDAISLSRYPNYTALYGSVFDMTDARVQHDFLKGFFAGRDMTLFHLKRLDYSDGTESLDDIRYGRLNNTQQSYLNAYLNEYAREYRYVGCYSYNK